MFRETQERCARMLGDAAPPAIRLHDLRHSFASFAIADGVSLFMVSKLLGHASPRTTEIYSHLAGDTLDDAAAAATRGLFPNSSNKAGAEIVNFRKGA